MSVSADFAIGAEALKRDGEPALWAQLESELRRRMTLGHFAKRFPTDRELMEIYKVSRHTARHAVAQLGSDGIVKRSRGIGTSIDTSKLARSMGSLYSLFQIVEEAGLTQHSTVRALHTVIDPDAARRLERDPDTKLLYLDRVRFAGPEPMAIDRVWLPADETTALLDSDFTHTSLYGELERSIGRRPGTGWEHIRPAVPTPDEREHLELDAGETVFSIERVGMIDDRPFERRLTTIPGRRFKFVADWTVGQHSEIRLQMIDPTNAPSGDAAHTS